MEGDTGEEEAELLLQSGGGGVWRVLSKAEHTRKGSRAVRNKTEKRKEEKRKEREREQMKQENQHRPTSL